MRFQLRWKILLFTVLAPISLALGTLVLVNRSVSDHVQASIREDLERSSLVFENLLSERSRSLSVAGQVIVRDPRFFSVLTLPASWQDPQFRATVRGVARDFEAITRTDLFEVLDRKGHVLASVGRDASTPEARAWLVKAVPAGRTVSGILVERRAHYQVTCIPVMADGQVVGALVLGAALGETLAAELRSLTHSEVTFVSGRTTTGSTLPSNVDRNALLAVLDGLRTQNKLGRGVLEVRGPQDTYLTLVRPIPPADGKGRQLYVMQRSVEAETEFLRRIRDGLVQLALVAMGVALVLGLLVAERITRPILQLVRGAEEMERGNYDHPIVVRREDEIGYLADRFRDMRQHERDYVNSLQEVARLKSEFINVASHELRTPISVIKAYNELFTQGSLGDVTPKQRQALDAIGHSLAGLTRIAEDATRIAQIQGERLVLQRSEVAIEEIVRGAVAAATEDGQNRNVRVNTRLTDDLGTAFLDAPRMTQAIANLVRNGIRFTPDGGSVDVSARTEGDRLIVRVRDTGVGIPEDRLDGLFSGSFMVRDSLHHHSSSTLEFMSAGLGLGLSIAYGIVQAHGGTLQVESRAGEGSLFVIRVPIELPEKVQAAA